MCLLGQFLVVKRIDTQQIPDDSGDDLNFALGVTGADQVLKIVALRLNRVFTDFAAHHALKQSHNLIVKRPPVRVLIDLKQHVNHRTVQTQIGNCADIRFLLLPGRKIIVQYVLDIIQNLARKLQLRAHHTRIGGIIHRAHTRNLSIALGVGEHFTFIFQAARGQQITRCNTANDHLNFGVRGKQHFRGHNQRPAQHKRTEQQHIYAALKRILQRFRACVCFGFGYRHRSPPKTESGHLPCPPSLRLIIVCHGSKHLRYEHDITSANHARRCLPVCRLPAL